MNATEAGRITRPSRVRYQVLAMTVALAAVTYLDRVCISVTAPAISRELGLSDLQMSFVFSAFTFTYAIFEIPSGYWGDRIGARRVLTRIVLWWSSFTMLTAGAVNFASLMAVRALFGAGEAGAWPNVARAFSRWFPAGERGTAQGVFFMGAHLAGGLTPLVVAALLVHFNWRVVFLVFGLTGVIWALTWHRFFRDEPGEHPSVSPAELEKILEGRVIESGHSLPFRQVPRLLLDRNVIFLCLMYFAQGYGFYFYITWLPTYLERVRGLSAVRLGILAGLPLMLSVVADLVGGVLTDWAVRRWGLRWGRASLGIVSFLGAGIALGAGVATSDATRAAVLISVAAAFSNLLLGASWGTCLDIGGSQAGVVSACMNTAGQIGGLLSPIIMALIVRSFASWNAPLLITALLYGGAAGCWLFIDASRPIRLSGEGAGD